MSQYVTFAEWQDVQRSRYRLRRYRGKQQRNGRGQVGGREPSPAPFPITRVCVTLPLGFRAFHGRRLSLPSWLKSWTSSQGFRKPWKGLCWGWEMEAVLPGRQHLPGKLTGAWLRARWSLIRPCKDETQTSSPSHKRDYSVHASGHCCKHRSERAENLPSGLK